MRPIEVPGRGTVHFPDGMTDEQISAAIKSLSPSAPSSGLTGLPNQKEQAAGSMTLTHPGTAPPEAIAPPGGERPAPPVLSNTPETRAAQKAEMDARLAGQPNQPMPTDIDQPSAIESSMRGLGHVVMTGATLAGGGFGAGAAMAAPTKALLQYMMPFMRYLPTGVLRVILGAAGEETVSQLQGNKMEDSLTGAGTIPLSVGVGTAVEAGSEYAKRKVPGVATLAKAAEKARQEKYYQKVTARAETAGRAEAATKERQLAGHIGKVVPPLKTRTAEELSRLGILKGTRSKEELLGPYFADKLHEANMLLPRTSTGAPYQVRVPSLAYEDPRWTEAIAALGLTGKTIPKHIQTAIESHVGAPRMIDRFTLDEVAEQMKLIGRKGYAGSASEPATRSIAGKPAREQYKAIMDDVHADLGGVNPAAWEAFREGRHAYSVGIELTRVLAANGVWVREPGKATLDIVGLRNIVRRYADRLRDRMSPDEYRDLIKIVFQGGEVAGGGGTSLRTLVNAAERAKSPGAKIPFAVQQATPHRWGDISLGKIALEGLILQGLSRYPMLTPGGPE